MAKEKSCTLIIRDITSFANITKGLMMNVFKMIFKKIKEKQKCQSCDNKFCISNNSPCYECKGNNLWTALDESAATWSEYRRGVK